MFKLFSSICEQILIFTSEKQQGCNLALIFLNNSFALDMDMLHSPCQNTELMDAAGDSDTND